MDTYLELNENDFVLGIPFTKVDAVNRIVEGFATLDNVDKAKDRLSFVASQKAFKKWAGNIREMHQKKAVGRKLNYTEKSYYDEETGETYNGMWLAAKVSKGAEDTWQKVLDGTLSGFSVGGAIKSKERALAKADGEDITIWNVTDYDLGEVSLVDNPCNPLATVALVKSADGVLAPTSEVESDDVGLEKAANAAVNDNRPPMKSTKPMQPQQPAVPQQPMQGEDDDMPFITKVVAALQAWRDSEAQDGDDHDLAFISSLIQQIKERVHAGDPGQFGSDSAVLGTNAKAEKLYKDADDNTDEGDNNDPEDQAEYAPIAYPAQHLSAARDHLLNFHRHAVKKGHHSMADTAHHLATNIDNLHQQASDHSSLNKAEPYGDVAYADPGYQADKKKRYPINTEEHIRAALSYINQADNASKYSADQLASIKSKIANAAKSVGISKSNEMEQNLQNNNLSDIPNVEELTDEHKGIIRKFVEFLVKNKSQNIVTQEVIKEEDEMDIELVKEAVGEGIETLEKAVDGKFDQVGESLNKVAEALEKLATVESLDALQLKLDEALTAVNDRLNKIEETGAVQKSADESLQQETLEKRERGFWASSIVPEFVQRKYADGI